ncbi:DUF1189 family protein [bacterium]|nr:DUF1189 family protein [candidate division CSSED10-310 bacterium]
MFVRFSFTNFVNWLTYSVDVRVYPGLRVLTFKLCVIFMAMLVLVSSLFIGTGTSISAYRKIGEIAEIYDRHFPPARLSGGKLEMQDQTPVVYRGNGYFVVMDVTGQQWEREAEFPIGLFFLKDKIVVSTDKDSRSYDYSFFGHSDVSITASAIRGVSGAVAMVSFTFWSIIIFIDWSLRTTLMAMIGSFVVGIVAALFRILLPRNEQLKIAITAAVPVTVLMVIEHLLLLKEGIGFGIVPLPPSLFFLNLLVFLAFLILGSRGYLKPYLPKDST